MFSYFTIIDEKDLSGATSYSGEILSPLSEGHKKSRSPLFFSKDQLLPSFNIIRLFRNFELVLIGLVLVQVLAPAAKKETVLCLFVFKVLAAK